MAPPPPALRGFPQLCFCLLTPVPCRGVQSPWGPWGGRRVLGGDGTPSRGNSTKPEVTQSLMSRGRKGIAHEEGAADDLTEASWPG